MIRPAERWWERWPLLAALCLLGVVPLLWPAIPPLTDLPGHMGRWYVSMAIGHSAALQRYYSFHWALIGNLGMDLAVPPLARVIGLEPATKILVMAIPPLTMAGLLWSAREAHGRVPPSAIMALPLAYAWPFQFGFINYELSQALALNAFALWLRLGRQERLTLRTVCFVPIGCLLWVAHDFGWGMFGLIAFGAELARQRDRGIGWRDGAVRAVVACLPLTLPVLLMLAGPRLSHGGVGAEDFFDLFEKAAAVLSMFHNRGGWIESLSIALPCLLLYAAARDRRLGYDRRIGWPALLCLVAFLLLPRFLLEGAYVDMRMAPTVMMLALIAIRPPAPEATRLASRLALLCCTFFGFRMAAQTVTECYRARAQQAELGAIAVLPHGAAALVLLPRICTRLIGDSLYDHLSSLAIVRRDAFVNDQWDLAGQQLLTIRYAEAAPYASDPSQLVYPPQCIRHGTRFDGAIAGFNRRAFSYVWTIGYPPGRARAPDLRLAWTNGRSALYRVVPASAARR